jgi:hypothetical protein
VRELDAAVQREVGMAMGIARRLHVHALQLRGLRFVTHRLKDASMHLIMGKGGDKKLASEVASASLVGADRT